MIRNHLSLLAIHSHRPTLFAVTYLVTGGFQFRKCDGGGIVLSAKNSRLINEVCQIGARHSGCGLSDDFQRFGYFGDRFTFGVAFKDSGAALHVGIRHVPLAIEASRPEQSLVEVLWSIRSGHDDDPLAAFEAVHGCQERIQGLLMLAVSIEFPVFADAIDLVDKNDR